MPAGKTRVCCTRTTNPLEKEDLNETDGGEPFPRGKKNFSYDLLKMEMGQLLAY